MTRSVTFMYGKRKQPAIGDRQAVDEFLVGWRVRLISF